MALWPEPVIRARLVSRDSLSRTPTSARAGTALRLLRSSANTATKRTRVPLRPVSGPAKRCLASMVEVDKSSKLLCVAVAGFQLLFYGFHESETGGCRGQSISVLGKARPVLTDRSYSPNVLKNSEIRDCSALTPAQKPEVLLLVSPLCCS